MTSTNSLAEIYALRLRHAANELRELRHNENWWENLNGLKFQLNASLKTALAARLLPQVIADAIEATPAPKYKDWIFDSECDASLFDRVFGYHPQDHELYVEHSEIPVVRFVDGAEDPAGGPLCEVTDETELVPCDYIKLRPGLIALAWPGLFDPIDECPARLGPSSDRIEDQVFHVHGNRIIGYYALACELLAEHAQGSVSGLDDDNAVGGRRRRGRLPADEKKTRYMYMLALLTEHPTLKDDPKKLARQMGMHESTVRRWIDEMNAENAAMQRKLAKSKKLRED